MDYNDLDLNLIKIFLTVYESKSILLASKKLYLSQPAVTNAIKRLESQLGGQLFIRTSKGVVPTAEGIQFNNSCYNAMQIMKNGIHNFNASSNLEQGTLNIGSSSTIMRALLLPFITQFTKRHSKIIISVTDAPSDKLIKYTKRGTVDLAVLNTPIDFKEDFHVTTLTQTTDCFIASPNFPLDFIAKDEIKNYPLILQKRPSNNRDYFEQMCELNNVTLQPNYEIGSFGLITDFTQNDMGIAYTVKDFIAKDLKNGRVKEMKTDFQIIPRDVVVITPQNSVNLFATKAFIEELTEYFKHKNLQ